MQKQVGEYSRAGGEDGESSPITERTRYMQEIVSEGLTTVKDACSFLAIGRSTLYQLMDNGELPWVKIGVARRLPKAALAKFATTNLIGGAKLE